MVAKGYVLREAHPGDRRVTLLRLTRRAAAALAEARRYHRSFEQGLARRMGARRAASLRAMLEELVSDEDAATAPLRPL
jgi:DNA-binding MarR family transcriptional regulator